MPRLMVDQLADTLVVQIQTAALGQRMAIVGDVLAGSGAPGGNQFPQRRPDPPA